ncbi:hypothetical protein D9Q98_008380 [Chlorella vulgaris]|uniref:Uncharacterized protein n=1 Tax=Chlorella vulgaris TaxID=3077 RepID=A0A9D4TGJ3_CHLVU|nr:hypothetical protein D9Q98_008380 [Chlorella vulgaris]
MPKPKSQQGAVFAISPWQNQREANVHGSAAPSSQPASCEVVLPLVVTDGRRSDVGGPAPALGCTTTALDAARLMAAQGLAARNYTASGAPAPATATPAAPQGGAWMAKRRRVDCLQEEGEGEAMDTETAAGGVAATSQHDFSIPGAAAEQQQAGSPPTPTEQQHAGSVELSGIAYLALLPGGGITGHFVCRPSAFGPRRRRSFGLMGEVLVAGRECTRDPDWGVLRMTLVSFAATSTSSSGSSSGGEVTFLAERSEGDAMHLAAPVPWQGIELEDLPALDAGCTCTTASGLTLDFRCGQLLTGPAGESMLRRLQPSLAGQGAVLNVGDMRLLLPPEAAATLLLTTPAAPPPRAQSAASGGARGADAMGSSSVRIGSTQADMAPAAPLQDVSLQQRRFTGSGCGSGRAIQDTGDDW